MGMTDFRHDVFRLEGEDAEVYVRMHYLDDGKPTTDHDEGQMLAVLLIKEQAFLNSFWREEDWPEDARRRPSINVVCSDVFAWGCADAETIDCRDIPEVYAHFEKDPDWGVAVWCVKRRGEMPQRPVYDQIKAGGIWDLDALGLRENGYDAACRASWVKRWCRQIADAGCLDAPV